MIAVTDRPSGDSGQSGRPDLAGATGVETVVVHERGQWAVDIVVFFPDSVVRRRISIHPTRRRAELSARLIKRVADRDLRGPLNG